MNPITITITMRDSDSTYVYCVLRSDDGGDTWRDDEGERTTVKRILREVKAEARQIGSGYAAGTA